MRVLLDVEQYEKNLISYENLYDIIIEDASHMYKDQIISLFMLFPILKSHGIFIVEELDFPDTRKDMNINNDKPTLREILNNILIKKDFKNQLISEKQKKYFIDNYKSIEILKGTENEIAMYDHVMDQGNPLAAYFAVQALAYRYNDARGVDGELLTGKAAKSEGSQFRSQAEVVRAMSDPKYDSDPAYRQDVYEKLERSTNLQF